MARNSDIEIGDEIKTEWRTVARNLERWLKDLHDELQEVVDTYTDKVFDEANRKVPVDTGNLKSTIEEKFMEKALEFVKGFVGTEKTDYADHVHFGTWKMEGRPFLTRALKKYKKPFIKAVAKTVTAHANKADQYKKA
jgi:HK97 gp10 family phage protein